MGLLAVFVMVYFFKKISEVNTVNCLPLLHLDLQVHNLISLFFYI